MNVTVPSPSTIYAWRGTVTTSAQSIAALAPAYQTSHAYSVGQVFSNNNIAYAVTKSGTSGSAAPTGVGVSIADASNSPSAPTYRSLTDGLRRAVVRNLDGSTTIDAGNASVTAGGGLPIMGGSPVGETLVQEIDSPSNLYLVAGGSATVAIEVY